MSELDFIRTSAADVLRTIIETLETGCAEPLYPGDERRIFGEAMAPLFVALYESVNDACRQKMLRYARGEVLDALGETRGIARLEAQPAKTTLRFGVNAALSQDVSIPSGTRATGDFVRYFATDAAATIPAGSTYVDVEATATEGGVDYNAIPAEGIMIIVDLLAYVDTVSNLTATAGGTDEESDDAFRERIRAASDRYTTAGSAASYRYWAIQADPRVIDAAVVNESQSITEDVEWTLRVGEDMSSSNLWCAYFNPNGIDFDTIVLKNPNGQTAYAGSDYTIGTRQTDGVGVIDIATDIGTLSGYSTIKFYAKKTIPAVANIVTIVPICANGQVPTQEILDKVEAACSAENVRPLTDVVVVQAPDSVSYDIDIDYYVPAEGASEIIAAVTSALQDFITWQSGAAGRSINPDKLRQLVLNAGATRVVVTSPVFTALDKTEIATFSGTSTATPVVEE